jgi:hypothetical protein
MPTTFFFCFSQNSYGMAVIGFKRFDTATVTIRRIELAETEKIKKDQFNLESLIGKHATAPQTWCSVVGRIKPGRPFVRRIISSCYIQLYNVHQNREEQLL